MKTKFHKSKSHFFILIVFAVWLLPNAATAQLDLSKLQPVDEHVIRCFINARCATHGDSTFTLEKFPAFFRTKFISKFYNFGEVIPFRIYYAEGIGKPLYYIQRGFCRGFSISCPPTPARFLLRPALPPGQARFGGNRRPKTCRPCQNVRQLRNP